MRRRRRLWPVIAIAIVLLTGTAVTAASVVAGSSVGFGDGAVAANDLKPPACAALTLTVVRGPVRGRAGRGPDALIVGTSASERINGTRSGDCIVGGGGNDRLRGNGGFDVCIGGPGADRFYRSCEVRLP